LGQGDNTLRTQLRFRVPGIPTALVAGNFNNDRSPDLAVASAAFDSQGQPLPGNVYLFRGLGNGTFAPVTLPGSTVPLAFPVGLHPYAIVAGQFNDDNGDGRIDDRDNLDLAVADSAFGTDVFNGQRFGLGDVAILLGNGDGTFRPAIRMSAGWNPISLAVGF